MKLRRKRWEEIAETLIGLPGTVKQSNRLIKCVIKEIVIESTSQKPKLFIITENDERFPLKRFEPLHEAKSKMESQSQISDRNKYLKEAQTVKRMIRSGKAELIHNNNSGILTYKVNAKNQPFKIAIFNERLQRVIKIL